MEMLALEPAVLNCKSRVKWTRLGSRLKRSHSFQTNRWRRWSGRFMSCSKKWASLPTMIRGLPRLRGAIRNYIEGTTPHRVCAEARNGVAAIEKATELHCDLIVLDLLMPLLNGV